MSTTKSASRAGSGIPARGMSTTDRARRKVDHPRSYGLGQRIADNYHGWADACIAPDAKLDTLPWLARIDATYNENAKRILAGTRDLLADDVRHIRAHTLEVAELDQRISDLQATLDAVRADDRPPGHGEIHLPNQAVTDRSERLAQSRRAQLRAEINALRERRSDLLTSIAEATARVEEEYEMTVTITARMRDYYQRRVTTYLRRFMNRRADLNTLHHNLALPGWTTQPCPWLNHTPTGEDQATHLASEPLQVLRNS